VDFLLKLTTAHAALGRLLDHLQSLALLATRCYVGWQLSSTTHELFTTGQHVPLSSAAVATAVGRGGALFFAALLFLGLFARVGALGALLLLLAAGAQVALGQHLLWGFMLAVLVVFGPGRIAVDAWLEKRCAARCRPLVATLPT
jgi:putative oxidoreductase